MPLDPTSSSVVLGIVVLLGTLALSMRAHSAGITAGTEQERRLWQDFMLNILSQGIQEIFAESEDFDVQTSKAVDKEHAGQVIWTISTGALRVNGPIRSSFYWQERICVLVELGNPIHDKIGIRFQSQVNEPGDKPIKDWLHFTAFEVGQAVHELRRIKAQLLAEQAERDKKRQTA